MTWGLLTICVDVVHDTVELEVQKTYNCIYSIVNKNLIWVQEVFFSDVEN